MILLRQKQFAKLEAGARVARNIWYRTGKLLQPILRKSDEQIASSAIKIGRKVNRVIRQPLAVGSNAMVNLASRPLETAGMPLVVAPELISTGIGGGMVLAGKGLRKIKPIGRLSDNFARTLRNTRLYKRAQNSTRGFHNQFNLPEPIYYTGLAGAGAGTGALVFSGVNKLKRKKSDKEKQQS